MKLIMDIDEDVRVAITRVGLLRISDEMQKKVDKAIQRGTPIPDNATNGFDNFCERTTWEWNRWWNVPFIEKYTKGERE